MRLTTEDASYMYARACRKWYGKGAWKIVKKQIRDLQKRGDASGVHAWTKVANLLRHDDDGSGVLRPVDFPVRRRPRA
jgi:hypothetical protein